MASTLMYNGARIVGSPARWMTQNEFDALTAIEKKGVIIITDEDSSSFYMNRRLVTVDTPVASSTYTQYPYQQVYTVSGLNTNDWCDCTIMSGSYSGQYACASAANSIIVYFSEEPSTLTMNLYWAKTVEA